ncbi:PEPxxWA-CTERM sorting domain-containing protein [Sandaracinobacteroides saxicola]|uniref:PEPxxWA-CTERM sorting domain-containing protein n=1 Tax=Sandaracinobacteroides saxicola TaxID=2759707 RepID=A0A7G5IH90_9SPHN|nr:PEPxxWA-CTERM sorting domain-containing protein [Sandaracinobacteroides saxicola]QMW22732.1 PEPxxWA-CTERM sorting domain-containing protein [Sandaracinobacteroides saxicola]
MLKTILTTAALVLALPASATVFSKNTLVPVFANQPGVISFSGGNLVSNGSFETGDFSGWEQVGDTSFTFVTDELAGGGPTDGDFHAAFGPLDPGGGGIVQLINTTAGGVYTLSFDLANLGGPPNAYGVFWDGGFVSIDFDLDSFDYQTFTTTLTASTSSTELGFIFYNEPSFFLLDNISLAVVPEPATWAMMILGFGLVGGTLRRRRHVAA